MIGTAAVKNASKGLVDRNAVAIVALWVVLIAVSAVGAAKQADVLTSGGFDVPGSQSAQVQQQLTAEFPSAAAATLAVVLEPVSGTDVGTVRQAVEEAYQRIAEVPDVHSGPVQHSRKGQISALVIPLTVPSGQDAAIDVAKTLSERFGIEQYAPAALAGGRVKASLTGQGALFAAIQSESVKAVGTGELLAFPVIALVLLVVFGSLVAMALPLGVGLTAVVITGGMTFVLGQFMSVSIFVSNAVSMVGIGVAVDYTLFVLARFRAEVASGSSIDEARRTAMRTSGRAAVISGATVILSLSSLFLINSTALSSIAIGAILVVSVAMAATATLVPSLIKLLGPRLTRTKAMPWGRWWPRSRRANGYHDFWIQWSHTVMRRPALFATGAILLLATLALPALDLKIGNSVLRQLPEATQARVATELAAQTLGAGAGNPVQIIARTEEFPRFTANSRLLNQISRTITGTSGVLRVSRPKLSSTGRSALLEATLAVDPESPVARNVVTSLRHSLTEVPGVSVVVGGTTASIMDFDELVSGEMVSVFGFVVIAGFLLLLIFLRSVVLAAQAVLLNLVAIGASYGVLVAVFQWGWLSWLGLEAGPTIDTITPPLILAITFGLTMDYEIFLLSRIRERWLATGDNTRSVGEGLAGSARVISSAALIMVLVFIAFVLTGLPTAQRLGLGLAVAVVIDATVVRLALVPALMRLFGQWNWRMSIFGQPRNPKLAGAASAKKA